MESPTVSLPILVYFCECSREEDITEEADGCFQASRRHSKLPVPCFFLYQEGFQQQWLFLTDIAGILFMPCIQWADNCTIVRQNKQLNGGLKTETLSVSISEPSCKTNCSLFVQFISHMDKRNCFPNASHSSFLFSLNSFLFCAAKKQRHIFYT